MSVAAIYDIHGNYYALEAVLKEIQHYNVQKVIIGGDLVWGPQPRKVMDTLMKYKDKFNYIMGNADREVAFSNGEEKSQEFVMELNKWCAEQLTDNQIEFLKTLPENYTLYIDGLGEVLFVHGSPRSDTEAIRFDTPEEEVMEMIQDVKENIIVCGHTHIQFNRLISNKRIVNAGSVGLQSRAKGACWLLLDNKAYLKETKYNFEEAAKGILQGECPYKEDFAVHILNPPNVGP
ncbi:metallophosphoesterase family protein [Virgibacillus kekensis]|uniref:Metallophosphoesterase family protein n=1 Tax=Virgibacillus kekensis TaxID=202261 RepID=A0ABV9DG12_9BACI